MIISFIFLTKRIAYDVSPQEQLEIDLIKCFEESGGVKRKYQQRLWKKVGNEGEENIDSLITYQIQFIR